MSEEREKLNAFVDGELPPEEMNRIAALVATRPELERYVRQQERLRTALKMEAVITSPVPQRLVQSARSASISWRWTFARHFGRQPGWIWSGGAALLAMGLVIGLVTRPAGDIALMDGQMIAKGNLREALDTSLASAPYAGKGPRMGLSFRDRTGADCRTFRDGGAAGLACHIAGKWIVQTTAASETETASGPYRMAGSEMPDAIRHAVEARIAGAPYDAAAETRARAAGWPGAR